ncbi:MAG TPA: hypothetical protein VJ201_05090 [Candidatus Babeliales bacterium]|nr:hypothetical protein [Candidatus Babeliales bacterium]
MHLEFYIYDNIARLNKIILDKTAKEPVNDIKIFPNGNFWFYTDLYWEDNHINTRGHYVHIHDGVKYNGSDTPTINPKKLKYNPKTRCLEYNPHWFPWKKPIFKKLVWFVGEVPKKKTQIMGGAVFDKYNDRIYFLLTPELATEKQVKKVEQLEKKLEFLSNSLS